MASALIAMLAGAGSNFASNAFSTGSQLYNAVEDRKLQRELFDKNFDNQKSFAEYSQNIIDQRFKDSGLDPVLQFLGSGDGSRAVRYHTNGTNYTYSAFPSNMMRGNTYVANTTNFGQYHYNSSQHKHNSYGYDYSSGNNNETSSSSVLRGYSPKSKLQNLQQGMNTWVRGPTINPGQ